MVNGIFFVGGPHASLVYHPNNPLVFKALLCFLILQNVPGSYQLLHTLALYLPVSLQCTDSSIGEHYLDTLILMLSVSAWLSIVFLMIRITFPNVCHVNIFLMKCLFKSFIFYVVTAAFRFFSWFIVTFQKFWFFWVLLYIYDRFFHKILAVF